MIVISVPTRRDDEKSLINKTRCLPAVRHDKNHPSPLFKKEGEIEPAVKFPLFNEKSHIEIKSKTSGKFLRNQIVENGYKPR